MLHHLRLLPHFITALLFLPLSTAVWLNAADFYLESGIHSEDLCVDLIKKKDQLLDNLDTLHLKNVTTPELRLGASCSFLECFRLEADGGVLLNESFSNQFSCRFREDMGSQTFHGRKKDKGSYSGNDFSVALGYASQIIPNWTLTALLGYAEQRRNFHLHPGEMKANTLNEHSQTAYIPTLSYDALWRGPWGGVRLGYTPCPKFRFLIDAQYHHPVLKTSGKWTVEEVLCDGYHFDSCIKSKQHGNAPGFKINAVIVREICSNWDLFLHGYYVKFCKKNGCDTTQHTQRAAREHQSPIFQGEFESKPHYRTNLQAWAFLGGINYVF